MLQTSHQLPCTSSTRTRTPLAPGPMQCTRTSGPPASLATGAVHLLYQLANFSASAEDVFWNMVSKVGAVQSLSKRDIGKLSWLSYNRISSRWVSSTGTRDKHRHTSWRNLSKLSEFLFCFFSFLICKWEWVGRGVVFIFLELL